MEATRSEAAPPLLTKAMGGSGGGDFKLAVVHSTASKAAVSISRSGDRGFARDSSSNHSKSEGESAELGGVRRDGVGSDLSPGSLSSYHPTVGNFWSRLFFGYASCVT